MLKKIIANIMVLSLVVSCMLSVNAIVIPASLDAVAGSGFKDIYSYSGGVLYKELAGGQKVYDLEKGGQEIIYKTDGKITGFYLQFIYNKYRLVDSVTEKITDYAYWGKYVSLSVSADGISYTPLTFSANGTSDVTNYKAHNNCDIKSGINLVDTFTRPSGYQGARMLKDNTAAYTPIDENARYLKVTISHENNNEETVCYVDGYVKYEVNEPDLITAEIADAASHPLVSYFDLSFNTKVTDAILTEPDAISITNNTVVSVVKNDDVYRVNLQNSLEAGVEYSVTLSDSIVSAYTGNQVSNKTLSIYPFKGAGNYIMYSLAKDGYPNIYSKSSAIVGKNTNTGKYVFDIPKGGQEIVYKTDGKITGFYFQFMYNKYRLVDSVTKKITNNADWGEFVTVSVSKDGTDYTPLTASHNNEAAIVSQYKYHSNANLKTGDNFSAEVVLTDYISGFQGARMIYDPNVVNVTALDEEIRYIKVKLTHENNNADTMYLFDGYIKYTMEDFTILNKKTEGTLSNGSIISASADIENNKFTSENAVIILGVYNEEKELIDINFENISIPAGSSLPAEVKITLSDRTDNYSGCYAKAFLWNDLKDINPLTSPW